MSTRSCRSSSILTQTPEVAAAVAERLAAERAAKQALLEAEKAANERLRLEQEAQNAARRSRSAHEQALKDASESAEVRFMLVHACGA